MKCLVLFISLVFATKHRTESAEKILEQSAYTPILVKIEEDENFKKISKFIGVTYDEKQAKWRAYRRRKYDRKMVYNGSYNDEETAAHASDTLAKKLMKNDRQKLKLNFPDDESEVYFEKENSSKYIGVSYNETRGKWDVYRWSKHEQKNTYNGCYDDEETAAHASDTLARKLLVNAEKSLKLNFPDDETEVNMEKKRSTSTYIGVTYNKTAARWIAHRRNKNEKKMVYNGCYKDEATAAHASDTLARKLISNSKQNHKLNFPDDETEVYSELRKKKRNRSGGLHWPETIEKLEGKKHELSFKNQLAD